MEEMEPLPQEKAQELREAANEFTLAAILDAVQPRHAWEVACRTEGYLAGACAHRGLVVHNKSLATGYDVNKRDHVNEMLREVWQQGPWKVWFSTSCVLPRAPDVQGDPAKLRRKQAKVRRQLAHIVEIAKASLETTNGKTQIYLEMPTIAHGTWRSSGVRALKELWASWGQRYYWTCVGPRTVLRNDQTFHEKLHEAQGKEKDENVTEAAGYPKGMVEDIARAWKAQYVKERDNHEVRNTIAAAQQIEDDSQINVAVPEDTEATDQMKQQARAMLTRLHRAAGHPSNRALARICRDRGLPRWVVNEALNLHCQACLDTKRGGTMQVPHSLGTKPAPWQMIGMDLFELPFPVQKRKARYLIAICLAMRLAMVEMVWQGLMNESGTDSGQKLVEVFASSWLQHRPKPEWILTDPQSSLAKGDFANFCGWIGCGLATTPGEAHWQNGAVETTVKAIKKTMRNENTAMGIWLQSLGLAPGIRPLEGERPSRRKAGGLLGIAAPANQGGGDPPAGAGPRDVHPATQRGPETFGGLPRGRLGVRVEEMPH